MVVLAVAGAARLDYLVIDTIERVVDFVLLCASYGLVLLVLLDCVSLAP
jgi:hypothetical protein